MCVGAPLMAIAGFAVSAAQTAVGFMADQEQHAGEVERYNENVKNANQSARDQYAQGYLRNEQERAAAGLEQQEQQLEGRRALGTAQVAASQSGVEGASVDAQMTDFLARESRYASAANRSFQWQSAQTFADMDGIEAQAKSRINSMPEPQAPSFAGALIRIAGAGLGAYSQYQRRTMEPA